MPGTSIPVAKADSTSTIERWFQTRTWRQTPLTVAGANAAACCVVFSDAAGLSDEIVKQLRSSGNQVITVIPGESFARTSDEKYQIQASARADYDALLADLEERGRHPQKFIHLWSMRAESTTISLEQALNFSFYSLLFLAQALGDQDLKKIEIAIVSYRLQSVLGETPTSRCVRPCLVLQVILKEFPEMGVVRSISTWTPIASIVRPPRSSASFLLDGRLRRRLSRRVNAGLKVRNAP